MGKKSRFSFSQREGFEPIKNVIQVDSIDEDLRNSLWNALHIWYWSSWFHLIPLYFNSFPKSTVLARVCYFSLFLPLNGK